MTSEQAAAKIKEVACGEGCKPSICNDSCLKDKEGCAFALAIQALEEVEEYRAIGTPEECLRNKDFLDFLSDKMDPDDFEMYLHIYNSLDEKGNNNDGE